MLHFYVFYGKNKVNTSLYSHLQEEERRMLASIEEASVLNRLTVREVLERQNLTVGDAVAATGLTFGTVYRAVYGGDQHLARPIAGSTKTSISSSAPCVSCNCPRMAPALLVTPRKDLSATISGRPPCGVFPFLGVFTKVKKCAII